MGSEVTAALSSWSLSFPGLIILILTGGIYLRGWLRGRKLFRTPHDEPRLIAFGLGLATLFAATESPLDALDGVYLSAHMAQHLLLMMVAPLLLLLGHPLLPLLRGLPKGFVKTGLGPFLSWPILKRVSSYLVAPPVAWIVFALSTIVWHLPKLYEIALSSPFWHGVQHASFFWTGLLFWSPIVQPAPYKSKWPSWVGIPYLLFADFVNTGLSAVFVFSGRVLYRTYANIHGNDSAVQDDQTIAGLIMWVPGSIIYLIPAFLLVMRVVSSSRVTTTVAVRQPKLHEITHSKATVRKFARWRWVLQAAMLALAGLVMADGWLGPQVAPLNAAGVLPWIHWRALSIAALLVVGNLFCMACPFTLFRDLARRVLPAPKRRWPSILRNKYLAAALLLIYLWAYEAFSLWDKPFVTAWIIAGYFLSALIIDGLFREASFCKYVCPIGQFNFVTSLLSPREVAVKRTSVCQSCKTFDCIRGHERQRGCGLYLFQPKKKGNLDCTFCLDCVKACPHDNVALLTTIPGKVIAEDPYRSSIGRLSKRSDWAVLAAIFVFGAFANAAGMLGPVMMWEHSLHAKLGPKSMPLIVAAFTLASIVIAPAVLILFCWWMNWFVNRSLDISRLLRRFLFTLIPLGVAMWSAHLLFHFATSWGAVIPVVKRMISVSYTGSTPGFISSWITPAQLLLLNAGLLATLFLGWSLVRQSATGTRTRFGLLSPWAAVSVVLYVVGVWILLQPMQMRGMIH